MVAEDILAGFTGALNGHFNAVDGVYKSIVLIFVRILVILCSN